MELKQSAQELLREKKILTPKDVPQEMCPYYTLHLAEEVADICFTVPYFHYTNDKIKMIHPRHLLIVDEDTTTRGHYPSCVELAVEYRVKDEYSIRNIILKEMMRFIDKLEKKVTEQGKGPKKDRHTPTNTIILNLISKINQVNTYLKSATDNNSPESIAAMHENISSIDLSNNLEDLAKIRVINKVDEYARELGMAHSNAALLFEPLLYPAQSRFEEGMCPATLTWIGGNSTPATLFAIADHTLIHVPKFEKLVVIGGTEAELFVKDVTEKLQIDKNDVKTIVLQEFKYANNYVFFEIYDPDGANKQKYNNDEENEEIQILPTEESIEDSKTLDATRYFRKFLYLFSEENRKYLQQTPYLLLTSTIKSQNNLTSWLGGGSIACTDHRINEIHTNHSTGRINVFYQNSIISRGLDVPMYHGTFVYSCNFATPYWTAMKNYFKDLLLQPAEDGADQDAEQKKFDLIKEKIDEYSNIIRRIQMDETTNGILRTAPIPGQYEDHIKIVVYTERHKGLVSGAQYNGTTIIPIPTTARIEPLISVFKRLVDPVLTKEAPGVPAAQHLPHPIHKSTIEEAKNLIAQYMNNYEDAVEAYNLPMERVGQEILLQPYLFKGNRLSETALIKYLQSRTQNRIPRKTIKRVVLRLAEENILKSSMSTFKEMCTINRAGDLSQSEMATVDDGKSSQGLHRMYYINQELLSQLTLSDDNARKEIVQSLLTKF